MLKSRRFYGIFIVCYIFMFFGIIGSHLQRCGNIEWMNGWESNMLYWSIGNMVGSFLISCFIYQMFPTSGGVLKFQEGVIKDLNKSIKPEKLFIISALIMFIAWLPCELAYYPGIFDYDVLGQIPQGSIVGYSKGHPLLHTVFLNSLYLAGSKIFGDGNSGIVLYTIVQMLILSGCISYAITYLYRQDFNKKICYGLTIWFAFFPTHAIMSVSTTKDVIFSCAMLVFMILIYDVTIKRNKKNVFYCIIWGGICALLRNNMIYAIVVFLVIIILSKIIWKKKIRISALMQIGVWVIAVYMIVNTAMATVLQAKDGSVVEMLSVPLQQLARTYNYGQMEDADQKILFELVPEDALNNYRPSLADPVKSYVNSGEWDGNRQQYIALYLKYLKKVPGTYANAFLELTRGMWYLDDISHIWVYGSPNYLEYSIRELPQEWNLPAVVRDTKWNQAKQYYDNIARGEWVKDVPVLSWLFAPATYCWMLIVMFGYSIYRRKWNEVLWQIPLLLYGATLLLGPAVLIRYVYFAFLLVPFVGLLIIGNED